MYNLKGYTQVNIKILLIQSYHTTCVSFSCEFIYKIKNMSVQTSSAGGRTRHRSQCAMCNGNSVTAIACIKSDLMCSINITVTFEARGQTQ